MIEEVAQMEPSKDSLGQKSSRRMNPWLFWCSLLGGLIMMPLVGVLLFSHRVMAAGFFHFASAAAITFSLVYYCLSRYKKHGGVGRYIAIVFFTVFLFGVLYVMIMTFYVVPFGGYNERHFGKQLETDLRSAYTHANAYLSEHPQERINRAEQLRAEGWKPSPEVSFESANLTAKGGMIVLKHKQLKNSTGDLKPGEGRVSTDGKDIKVEVPAPY
jgi:hypothetical protein